MINYIFKNKTILLTLVVLSLVSSPLLATNVFKDGIHISAFMGTAKSMNNRLILYPKDSAPIRIDAEYDSKSDSDSAYWYARIENWHNNEAWGLELIHHKLYLRNPQQGVTNFSISDGYNLFYLTKAWRLNNEDAARLGVGLVFAHPDVTFGGRDPFHEPGFPGMFLAGPSIMAAYEKRFFTTESNFVSIETKVTASYATFPISDLHSEEQASAPDLAFHIALGFGSLPPKKDANIVDYALYTLPIFYPTATAAVLNMK
jgi:hypothetical protein